MNIPKDIAEKYNYLKQQTFDSLGIPFTPGVITFQPQPQTQQNTSSLQTQNYNSNLYNAGMNIDKQQDLNTSYNQNYNSSSKRLQFQSSTSSNGDNQQQLLFSQLEEIFKSFTEHSSNMMKGIVLEEDNSFIQESLSKRFLEPLYSVGNKKDQNYQVNSHYNQIPKEFLVRVDQIKFEFDQSIRKLIDHFYQQKEEFLIQNERKIDLLKQENNKLRIEIQNIKNEHERNCKCKIYDETLYQIQQEHQRYVDKIKQKYENEIYELRNGSNNNNFDVFRDRIFSDLNKRVLSFVQEKHHAYLNTYSQEEENNGKSFSPHLIDPIELMIFICTRLSNDNNWLVDKLAEVQENQNSNLIKKHQNKDDSTLASDLLNSTLFSDIIEQTKISQEILENFNFSRNEFLANIDDSTQSNTQKENIPMRRSINNNNYSTNASNLRESLASNAKISLMNKSQSGKNLNLKYHQLMRTDESQIQQNQYQQHHTQQYDSLESERLAMGILTESQDYYNEQNLE